MKDLTTEQLMEALENAAAAEFVEEYFGDWPKYNWKEVKEEIQRRLK